MAVSAGKHHNKVDKNRPGPREQSAKTCEQVWKGAKGCEKAVERGALHRALGGRRLHVGHKRQPLPFNWLEPIIFTLVRTSSNFLEVEVGFRQFSWEVLQPKLPLDDLYGYWYRVLAGRA